jgi:hypothetical protein
MCELYNDVMCRFQRSNLTLFDIPWFKHIHIFKQSVLKIWVILSISLLFDIPSISPNSVTRHWCRSLEKSHMGFPDRCTVNVCPDRLSFKVLEFFRWILDIPIDIRLHLDFTGGQDQIRRLWSHYYRGPFAGFFMTISGLLGYFGILVVDDITMRNP